VRSVMSLARFLVVSVALSLVAGRIARWIDSRASGGARPAPQTASQTGAPRAEQPAVVYRPAPPQRAAPASSMPGVLPDAAQNPPAAPSRPLNCADPAAVLAFKKLVRWEAAASPPAGGTDLSEAWAECLCGAQARGSGPAPSVQRDSQRALPACPVLPRSTPGPRDVERIQELYIDVAKDFYEFLPLSKPQAIRIAECYCGAMPR